VCVCVCVCVYLLVVYLCVCACACVCMCVRKLCVCMSVCVLTYNLLHLKDCISAHVEAIHRLHCDHRVAARIGVYLYVCVVSVSV